MGVIFSSYIRHICYVFISGYHGSRSGYSISGTVWNYRYTRVIKLWFNNFATPALNCKNRIFKMLPLILQNSTTVKLSRMKYIKINCAPISIVSKFQSSLCLYQTRYLYFSKEIIKMKFTQDATTIIKETETPA